MPPRQNMISKASNSSTARGPTSTGTDGASIAGPQSRFARLHGMTATQQQAQQQHQRQGNFVNDFIERGGGSAATMPVPALSRASTGDTTIGTTAQSGGTPEGGTTSGTARRRSSLPGNTALSSMPSAITPSSGGTFLTATGGTKGDAITTTTTLTTQLVSSSNYLAGTGGLNATQLEQRLRMLQNELDTRTDNVNAVQRNFERLSQMYTKEKKQFEEAEERVQRLMAELESLRAEKKLFVAVRTEFVELQNSHAKALETVNTLKIAKDAAEKHLEHRANDQRYARHQQEVEKNLRELEMKLGYYQKKVEQGRKQRQDLVTTIFGNFAKKLRRIGGHAASIIDAMECAVDAHLVSGGGPSSSSFSLSGGAATEAELNSTGEALKAFLQRGASPPNGATRREVQLGRKTRLEGEEEEGTEEEEKVEHAVRAKAKRDASAGPPLLVPELRTIAPTPSRGIGADLTEVFSNTKFSGNTSKDEGHLRDSRQLTDFDFDNDGGSSDANGRSRSFGFSDDPTEESTRGSGGDRSGVGTESQSASFGVFGSSGGGNPSSINSSGNSNVNAGVGGANATHLLAAAAPQHGSRQSSFKRKHLGEAMGASVPTRSKSVSYASPEGGPSSAEDDEKVSKPPLHPPQPHAPISITRSPNISASSGASIPPPLNPLALSETRPISEPSSSEANANKTLVDRYGRPVQGTGCREDGGVTHEAEGDEHFPEPAAPQASVSPSRGRKRLNLLSSQFDALENALAACEKEVLPCIVQYLKFSKALEQRSKQQHTYEVNRMQDTIDMLVEEKNSMHETLEEWKSKHSDLAAKCLEERHAFQKQVAELEEKVKLAAGGGKKAAQESAERVSELEHELSRSKSSLQKAERDRDEAGRHLNSLHEEVRSLELRLASANELTTAATTKLEEAQSRAKGLNEKVENVEQANANLERTITSLRVEVQQLRAASTSGSDASKRELEALVGRLTEAEERANALATTREEETGAASHREAQLLENVKNSQAESQKLKEELRSARVEISTLASSRDALLKDLAEIQKEQDDVTTCSQSEIKRLKQANSELSIELTTLKQQLSLAGERSENDQRMLREAYEAKLSQLRAALDDERRRTETAEAKAAAAIAAKNKAEQQALELSAATDIANRQRNEQLQKERDALNKARLSARDQMTKVKTLQVESAKAIAKLQAAEKSSESSYSCQTCLSLLKAPLVCAPCGHMYCKACLEGANRNKQSPARGATPMFCPECDGHNVVSTAPCPQMDTLASKFEYRQRVLADLAALMAQSISKDEEEDVV